MIVLCLSTSLQSSSLKIVLYLSISYKLFSATALDITLFFATITMARPDLLLTSDLSIRRDLLALSGTSASPGTPRTSLASLQLHSTSNTFNHLVRPR